METVEAGAPLYLLVSAGYCRSSDNLRSTILKVMSARAADMLYEFGGRDVAIMSALRALLPQLQMPALLAFEEGHVVDMEFGGADSEEDRLTQVSAFLSRHGLLGDDGRRSPLLSHTASARALGLGWDLNAADLSGTDLRGADLSGRSLAGANLAGADLRGADLHGALFSHADLHGARLDGAVTAGTVWLHSRCPDGSLSDALPHASCLLDDGSESVTHPTAHWITGRCCEICAGTDLQLSAAAGLEVITYPKWEQLLRSPTPSMVIIGSHCGEGWIKIAADTARETGIAARLFFLPGAYGCVMRTGWSGLAVFPTILFLRNGKTVDKQNLRGATDEATRKVFIHFAARNGLLEADEGYAHDYRGVTPAPTKHLVVAQLQGADFSGRRMPNAFLAGSNLTGASFRKTDLRGANFSHANLEGADFRGARLDGAFWLVTRCPDGTMSNLHGDTCLGHLSLQPR